MALRERPEEAIVAGFRARREVSGDGRWFQSKNRSRGEWRW